MFKKTVDSVLAGFQKTVQDLRDIGERQQATVNGNNEKIASLVVAVQSARQERDRANAIADKLAALIS